MSKKKSNVLFSQPEEPAFLKRMKEKIGYKEGPTVDTKKQKLAYEDSEERHSDEEEKPQVVVLKSGDLTREEVDEHEEFQKRNEGKIIFKPRDKRKVPVDTSASGGINETSIKKRAKCKHDADTKESGKGQRNKSLLSFDEGEDDDDS